MFQIKSFPEVVDGMVSQMQSTQDRITDFAIGSVARTLVEAPAIEIDELYQRMLAGLLEAIPVAVFGAFEFTALGALRAAGYVRFSTLLPVEQAVDIPIGTWVAVTTDRRRYQVSVAGQIPSGGTYADVMVEAEYAGLAGNAEVGEVSAIEAYIPDVTSVTNLVALTSGSDGESAEELRMRFVAYIASLSRGTLMALDYAIRTAVVLDGNGATQEYVLRVGVTELPGHVRYYIYGSALGTPSAALLERAQKIVDGYTTQEGDIIPGYRPAGVRVDVLPMTERSVPISITVSTFTGVTQDALLITAIEDAISAEMANTASGKILYVDQITAAVLSVDGVHSVMIGNDENILCASSEVITLGTVTVTWQ